MGGFTKWDPALNSTSYKPGQRWVSNAEPEAGLGIVVAVEGRNLEVSFPAIGELRRYTVENAPLNRIQYRVGETVYTADGQQLVVAEFTEQAERYFYLCENSDGEKVVVDELDLDSFVHFSGPREKLFSGQLDASKRYRLRRQTLEHQRRLQEIETPGLLGARVQLLPHQFYIASEVAARFAPRVLLADEVGLGKTIEAGLIIHQQLVTGRASRVLIVVPESLLHQWLVEMLRRFNLMFSVLNEEQWQARQDDNPFEQSQLVLCSLDFLVADAERQAAAAAAGWDLMVVDEAHHLHWHDGEPSPQYQCIEGLAERVAGLILLTATPEQLGLEGHFARLRLLDPARYPDLARFRAEEAGYHRVRELAESLIADNAIERLRDDPAIQEEIAGFLGREQLDELLDVLAADLAADQYRRAVDDVVRALVDRHGTGRVLFRNTREAVPGFPDRVFNPHPLPVPAGLVDDLYASPEELLHPEQLLADEWLQLDPRVEWLQHWLPALRDEDGKTERALVICASATTAAELDNHLSLRCGIRSAAFHEGMSLLQRDRAAAYFADDEDAAQVLICSEIGSEGRNFQFVRHLVLFDVPLNPDLLEQRIGRLDRIGQRRDVQIHVPHYESGPQRVLVDWYHRGLNAFERVCPMGGTVYEQVEDELMAALEDGSAEAPAALLETTARLSAEALRRLRDGRDRLLELSSCHPERAAAVLDAVREGESPAALAGYMERVFDLFNVEQGHHSQDAMILHPGDHMPVERFPDLSEDGMTVTFDRDKALSREDMHFLSWEHPMVRGAMDMILSGDFGNVTLCSLKLPPMKAGTLLVEAVYTVHCPAPRALQLHRFLPLASRRVVVDVQGNDLTAVLAPEHLDKLGQKIDLVTAQKLVKHATGPLATLLDRCDALIDGGEGEDLFAAARQRMEESQRRDLQRLQALAEVNPNIRQEELDHVVATTESLREALAHASWRLDAVRVAITT